MIAVWGLPRSLAFADSATDGLVQAAGGTGTVAGPVGPRRWNVDLDRKIRRLRAGVGTSAVAAPAGAGMLLGGIVLSLTSDGNGWGVLFGTGIVFMAGGTVGLIVTAVQLHRYKNERRRLEENRRVRWSPERGAFVF